MNPLDQYKSVNKEAWNAKVLPHMESDFYNHRAFLDGKCTLNDIELDMLPDVRDKKLLHLQCHFGQDTMSWSRRGAKATGVDFSNVAVEKAQETAAQLKLDTRFIYSDIFDLPSHLDEQFDIIFTSYGTIGWLPDLDRWAEVIEHFLRPGGTFLIVDFHPVVWMFDDDFTHVKYRYFNDKPIIESEEGSYTDGSDHLSANIITWNHGLSEIMTALMDHNIQISDVKEYDYSPYACFNHVQQVGEGKYQIKQLGNKIPMVYAIQGTKVQE